jgi:hypothetical protein
MQLTDEQRIDRAARLMTLLQNMLVIRGVGLEAGANASVQFKNYGKNFNKLSRNQHFHVLEGQVQLKAPMPPIQDMPMINRAMRIQTSEASETSMIADEKPDHIEFSSGGQMQLPSSDFLSKQPL